MSDLKLFRLGAQGAVALPGRAATVEKQLQALIERHMEALLGVRFLASEHSTGKVHGGRIDSLGLDENGCPVILEYKRHQHESVINQGLFYLDWLLDHKAEFRWLVLERLGREAADQIEWGGTRVLCIAADFTRYDLHAVAQIGRSIELIRYKLFGDDLLSLELVNAPVASGPSRPPAVPSAPGEAPPELPPEAPPSVRPDKSHAEQLALAPAAVQEVFAELEAFIAALGEDVQVKVLKKYVAFKRLRNLASATVIPKQDPRVVLWLALDPSSVALEEGFTRDVRQVGHWGPGDLEVSLRSLSDLERAKPLILRCHEES